MRNKKARKIVVNGLVYYWKIGKVNADGDGNCFLTIKYANREIYWEQVRQDITPGVVREIIEKSKMKKQAEDDKAFVSQAEQLVRIADKMEACDKGSPEWKAYNAEYKIIAKTLIGDRKKK